MLQVLVLGTDPGRGVARGARAAALTLPAVGGASLAHQLADGCSSVVALLLALGVCWPAAVALLGCRRRAPAVAAVVLGAQLVTHLLYDLACPSALPHAGGWARLTMGEDRTMLLAHLLAAVLVALLLTAADAGLWAVHALHRRLLRLALVRLPALLPRVAPGGPLRRDDVPVPASWQSPHPVRRGPPVLSARLS